MSHDRRARRDLLRFVRPARGAGLMLAVPAFLAIGTATMTLLLAGVATVLFAPALRGTHRNRRRKTITLDRTAYRVLDDTPALSDEPHAQRPTQR